MIHRIFANSRTLQSNQVNWAQTQNSAQCQYTQSVSLVFWWIHIYWSTTHCVTLVQTLVDRKEQDVKPGLSRENFSRTDCQLLLCSNSTAWSGNRHDDRTQEPMLVPGAIVREMYLCYRGWRLPSSIRLQTIHLQLCPGCDLVADRSQWSSVTSRAIHL